MAEGQRPMPLHEGIEKGDCNDCGKYSEDLYKGYCLKCRRKFGRDNSGGKYSPGSSKVNPDKQEARDWKLKAYQYQMLLSQIITLLSQNGFSGEERKQRYYSTGLVSELDRLIGNCERFLKDEEMKHE